MMMDKTYEVYYFSPDNPTHLEQWLEGILRTTGLRLLAVTGDYWIFEQTNLFDTSAKVGSLASDAMESYAEFYDKAVVALGFSSGALPSQQMDDMMLERITELARRDEKLALTEFKLCNIDRSARVEIARRDEIIARLKEDANRLAEYPHPFTDVAHIESGTYCHYCHKSYKVEHDDWCPITLHRALIAELEKETEK